MHTLLTLFHHHPETGLPVLVLLVGLIILLNHWYGCKPCYTYHDPRYTKEGGKAATAIQGEKKLNSLTVH